MDRTFGRVLARLKFPSDVHGSRRGQISAPRQAFMGPVGYRLGCERELPLPFSANTQPCALTHMGLLVVAKRTVVVVTSVLCESAHPACLRAGPRQASVPRPFGISPAQAQELTLPTERRRKGWNVCLPENLI